MNDVVEIVVPGETFRLTYADQPVLVEGLTFTPAAVTVWVSHDEACVVLTGNHPLVKRTLAGGVRRKQTDVRILRVDEEGKVVLRWSGELVGLEVTDTSVEYRAESSISMALSRPIGMRVTRTCQHQLFDVNCGLKRERFAKTATIVAMLGCRCALDIELSPDWVRDGELRHALTGERVSIVEAEPNPGERGAVLVLQAVPYNAKVGDSVEIAPGCDRRVETCRDRFNNVRAFGGFPFLPTKLPFEESLARSPTVDRDHVC